MDRKQSPSEDAAQYQLDLGPIDLTDPDLDGDTLREECGVFGIFGHPEAAAITALGLHALQHRGQEAAGIVSFDGTRFHSERRLGLVGDTFSRREVIERLPGPIAVGHVRYSTTGATILRNVQPLFAELNAGGFAVGHNGNLTNGLTLRRELVRNWWRSPSATASSTASSRRCAPSRAPIRWCR
jgi:amidophosphoribosyltransferase